MRYFEIIGENDALQAVTKANHKSSIAASRYHDKLRDSQDQTRAAKELAPGAERARREGGAEAKRAAAAQTYQNELRSANEASAKAREKAQYASKREAPLELGASLGLPRTGA